MPEFLSLIPPDIARERFLSSLNPLNCYETIETVQACGRILAENIRAPHALPEFARLSVDGYAVFVEDTFGASDSLPFYAELIGSVKMGCSADLKLSTGQCALIHTGGMLPDGANAVVMLENTRKLDPLKPRAKTEIEIYKPVAFNENVIPEGEDVKAGDIVITSGRRLLPAEIGGLMALGITQVRVSSLPGVGIISNGDEIIDPTDQPARGQVRDVNMSVIGSIVEQAGARAIPGEIVPDQEELLYESAKKMLDVCDILVITAGSSASSRDFTAKVINRLGKPGVLVHGVNVHPGKPTILAICDGKPVIGLPGNPVSALIIARLFVIPVIKLLLGERDDRPQAWVPARLATNISSQAGREDWIAVKLIPNEDKSGWLADPVFGKSNLIFTLVRADGLIRIESAANGLKLGEAVRVYVF